MSTRKRVVHLTTVHHPYDPRIYHKQLTSLQKAGFDVTLLAQTSEDANVKYGEKPIRHIPLKKYTNRFMRMTKGAYEAYKKAKYMKADVYHFHDPELLPVGWLLKRKDNVVIFDIHEDYLTSILQKDYLPEFVKKFVAKIYDKLESYLIRDMELSLAEKYYKERYPDGKWILNYPTVNDAFIHHERKGERENKLLYTGNVSLVRGAMEHAAIPQIVPGMEVRFVGKCPRDLAMEMYYKAGSEKNQLKIEGIDTFIEKEVIERRYLERNWLAGIALFPPTEHYMKKELTKFFEYMNAGLPIICSNFPVWKDFVETYQCGIAVDPDDAEAIREAIHYLQTHPEVAKQMGENGKKAVLEELNWETEEKKLINWYEELLQIEKPKREGIDV